MFEDDFTSECAILNLNTREIFRGNKGALFPGTNVRGSNDNIGYMTAFGGVNVYTNIDFQKLLGDMFNKYDIFEIDLKQIISIPNDINNSFNLASSSKYSNLNVYLSGLNFIDNRGTNIEEKALMTNLGEKYNISTNTFVDTNSGFGLASKYTTESQEDNSSYLFKKHYGVKPITLSIGSIDDTVDIPVDDPVFLGGWTNPPPLFVQFQIRPIA